MNSFSFSCIGLGAAFLLFAAGGHAQQAPMEIPQAEQQILLGVDEAKIYRFNEIITRVEMTKNGIVEAVPRSQTELTLAGLSVGQTPIFVIGEGGRRIYSGVVIVSQEPGHAVRIYRPATETERKAAGNRSDGKVDAADEYWCSSIKCSDVVRKK